MDVSHRFPVNAEEQNLEDHVVGCFSWHVLLTGTSTVSRPYLLTGSFYHNLSNELLVVEDFSQNQLMAKPKPRE